jgi:hypothetical protein
MHPSLCYHVKRVATKCGHEMHFSASPHTPYCPSCVYSAARAKKDAALDCLVRNGGYNRSRDMSYKVAIRHLEQVRQRGRLQWKREQAWDEAHSKAHVGCRNESGSCVCHTDCLICVAMMGRPGGQHQVVIKDMAWWERPGGLAVNAAPQTPPRSREQKQTCTRQAQHKGSPTMRGFIQEHRAAHAAETAKQEQLERRYKTEEAVRRKHQLCEDTYINADFWNSPISGLMTRQNHVLMRECQRMSERRARGNTPRPRPPRSSLSLCESAGEPGNAEVMRAEEEARERERWERKARKVGAEVGYLYFSGTTDGLEEWRDEYLRSNHNLIWRDGEQHDGDVMELDG